MVNSLTPQVSICIPAYNAAATIRDTLLSILAQTYPNLDIHVFDNASTDNTLEVVRTFTAAPITIHTSTVNLGGEANFERCFKQVYGKYTAIYHADDIYEPDMVQRQVEFLERYVEAGAVFTEATLINERGDRVGAIGWPSALKITPALYHFPTLFKAVLRYSNFLICPSAMVRTSIYQQEIQTWRGDMFGTSADLDVWLRISQQHFVGLIAEPLMRYRISSAQFSAQDRAGVARATIFRVFDYYLNQEVVAALLDKQDRCHYARLERRDRIGRAINLLLIDRPQEAKALCYDIFSSDAIRAAFASKRGLVVLLAGGYVRLAALFPLTRWSKLLPSYLKRITLK